MGNVSISPPTAADRDPFVEAVRRSTALHGLWVSPPSTPAAFDAYLERVSRGDHAAYVVRLAESVELAGVVNISIINREPFSSAFLGFYAFEPHANRGHMQAGLRLVLERAFGELGLHRVEAKIQPNNAASIALVRVRISPRRILAQLPPRRRRVAQPRTLGPTGGGVSRQLTRHLRHVVPVTPASVTRNNPVAAPPVSASISARYHLS